MKHLAFLIVLSVAAVAQAQTTPQLTATKKIIDGAAEVEVVVRADHIVINGMTANRGNCRIYSAYAINGAVGQKAYPFTLNFGDHLTLDMFCDPIELQADTDHGVIPIPTDK